MPIPLLAVPTRTVFNTEPGRLEESREGRSETSTLPRSCPPQPGTMGSVQFVHSFPLSRAGLRAYERSELQKSASRPSPSHAKAQWRHDGPTLDYRCGGSVGMLIRKITDFPFTWR